MLGACCVLVDIVILLVIHVLPSVLITGAIAGIVIVGAGLLLLLAVVSICFICYIRHKINTLTLSNEVSLRGSMKVVPQTHALITRLIY